MERLPKEAVGEWTTHINPIALQEGKMEYMNAFNPQVLENFLMSSTSFENTEAFKAINSNMDYTVSVEAKGDPATLDISRTREFPEFSSDKMLHKENQREIFCLSNNQDIVVDESGQPTRKNPEVLSDIGLAVYMFCGLWMKTKFFVDQWHVWVYFGGLLLDGT